MFTLQQIKENPFLCMISFTKQFEIYQCNKMENNYFYITRIWNENTGFDDDDNTNEHIIFRRFKTNKQINNSGPLFEKFNNRIFFCADSLEIIKLEFPEYFI